MVQLFQSPVETGSMACTTLLNHQLGPGRPPNSSAGPGPVEAESCRRERAGRKESNIC